MSRKPKPKAKAPQKKAGPGRKPFAPTPENKKIVLALAGYGVPEFAIASELKIDPKTLRKHFRHELDHGISKANALVAESLFKKAIGNGTGGVAAAIFWAKTRMGWRETVVNEHSGPNGGPIETKDTSARDIIADRLARITGRSDKG